MLQRHRQGKEPFWGYEGTTLKHAIKSSLPEFTLNRSSAIPLHQQLYQKIYLAITNERTPVGAALPSTRALAKMLGVSRNTVVTAYEILASEGLLVGKSGSATRVCGGSTAKHRRRARRLDPEALLRKANYPSQVVEFTSPDGDCLYAYRT
jgi:DNA-binding GntR family transcriptional regulator